MAGSSIHFKLDDKAFRSSVDALGGVLRTGVIRSIGVALLAETERRFDTGHDPSGQRWRGLLPAYAAIKRGNLILVASGTLRRSLTMQTSGNQVTVGSIMRYAAVHQFGATIKPVSAKALTFRLGFAKVGPRGGKGTGFFLVHAKSVTIPARPYLGFGPDDQRAVMETLSGFINRTLKP